MQTHFRSLMLLSVLCLSFGCQSDSASNSPEIKIPRPYEPFIFRSVLDAKPRMVTLALDDKMWAAYSASDCSLYKVWIGQEIYTI